MGKYVYKEPVFHNSDGSLTTYSFACGYIEQAEVPGRNQCELSAANMSISLYDIRGTVSDGAKEKYYWIQVTGLTKARKAFKKVQTVLKRLHNGWHNLDSALVQISSIEYASNH